MAINAAFEAARDGEAIGMKHVVSAALSEANKLGSNTYKLEVLASRLKLNQNALSDRSDSFISDSPRSRSPSNNGNASIYRSKLVKNHQNWLKQGLSVFFLPPYSPEMNRIEEQWCRAYPLMSSKTTTGGFSNRALKRQELGGYVFEDEYDLALAIIKGIESRGQQGNYYIERLLFN